MTSERKALVAEAHLLQLAGDAKGACQRQAECVEVMRRGDRGDRHNLGAALGILSAKQLQTGDAKSAVASARESVDILEKAFGPTHHQVAHARKALGEALVTSGEVADGRAALPGAATIWRTTPGDVGEAAPELCRIARSIVASGDVASARGILQDAVERSREVKGPRRGLILGFSLYSLGELERDAGNTDRAITVLREAVTVIEADPPDPSWPADFRETLAKVLESHGEKEEAASLRARTVAEAAAREAAATAKAAETATADAASAAAAKPSH
jgi:ATP/maltotriose-dependent transcriptional regulator MalT